MNFLSALLPMLEMLLRIKAITLQLLDLWQVVLCISGIQQTRGCLSACQSLRLFFFFLKDFQKQITEDLSSQIKRAICHR